MSDRETFSLTINLHSTSHLHRSAKIRFYKIPWSVVGAYFGSAIALGAFTHLKTLELSVTDFTNFLTSETTDIGETQNLLGQALQSVTELRSLLLNFTQHDFPSGENTRVRYEYECDRILWSRIFGNNI